MLSRLLLGRGIRATVLSSASLASEMVGEVTTQAPAAICISALPPFAATHARYLCKRLVASADGTPIVAGLWRPDGEATKAEQKLDAAGASHRVSTVGEAADVLAKLVASCRLLDGA